MSTDYCYAPSLFLKLGEIIVEYIVYKSLFGFPLFCFLLLPFYEGFSNLVKNEEFREGYKSNFCEQ